VCRNGEKNSRIHGVIWCIDSFETNLYTDMAVMAAATASIIGTKQQAAFEAAQRWLDQPLSVQVVPADVQEGLNAAFQAIEHVNALKVASKRTFTQLLRALKIIPSSEKGNATHAKDPDEPHKTKRKRRDPIERLHAEIEYFDRMHDWHAAHAKRNKLLRERAQDKLDKMKPVPPFDDEDFSEEEKREAKEATAAFMARARQGERDPSLNKPSEPLMMGGIAQLERETVPCDVDRDELPKNAKITATKHIVRERIDFSFCVTVQEIVVEKLFVTSKRKGSFFGKATGESSVIVGDMHEFGPSKVKVTWRFLANMILMVTLYAMPMNRFARLASSKAKRFSSADICRYYRLSAEHLAPIYIHLGKGLANAPVISGDDTSSVVLEVRRALKKKEQGSKADLPWQAFANQEQAKKSIALAKAKAAAWKQAKAKAVTPQEKEVLAIQRKTRSKAETDAENITLSKLLAAEFGFAASYKNGPGEKIGFNTSVVSGRTVANDPKSTIVFYRSHLGGFGNMLDVILHNRRDDVGTLVVQGDLATVNLVSDKSLREKFNITLAGCAAHARRPFAIYEKDDPEVCEAILHLFKGFSIAEQTLDAVGRNRTNMLAVRGVDERAYWEDIRDYCEEVKSRWASKTPLGDGARYILRHYDKLTYYLTDPRVEPWNTHSERMLREEKLIGNNSLFRETLDGRCSLDIMRTLLQTCFAAEVNPSDYLIWVMMMPKDAIAADPGAYTPYDYGLWKAEQVSPEEERTT
jgi:Transposase IS66 family